MTHTLGRRQKRGVALVTAALLAGGIGAVAATTAAGALKSGLTVYFIPKDTLNPYEVIADSGGKTALDATGNTQVVSSGTQDTAAAQIPSIQTAIQSKANAIVIAGNDPAGLCQQLDAAKAQGIAVVSFDSDVNCRQLFINQANTETIGRSQVALLAKEIGYKGQFAILSAASTATNQNAWIKFMKLELKKPKYKNMKLVKIYYGNDNPAQSLQATQAMLQAFPNLKGIISPTTVGISSAAQFLSHSKFKNKVKLTGLGPAQPDEEVRAGRHGQGVRALEPQRPRLPGRVRRRGARVRRHHGQARARASPPASSASTRSSTPRAGRRSSSAPRSRFNKSNVAKFKF